MGILKIQIRGLCVSGIIALLLCVAVRADDWPTYMHDAARSGVSTAKLGLRLNEQWQVSSPSLPRPAWPAPARRMISRVDYDRAFYTIAVGDTVYFGSSVENQIRAVDAETGAERWRFLTEGPVRMAPAWHKGRVYAGCDDGYLYCMDASTGELIWKFLGGPAPERLIGNGRLVSRWPLRSGIAIRDNIVYFAAGIFPSDNTFVIAVDADKGGELWRSASLDSPYKSGMRTLSPQGYILVSDQSITVPSNRKAPSVFDRADGTFRYSVRTDHSKKQKLGVGHYALLEGENLIVGTQGSLTAVDQNSGNILFTLHSARRIVLSSDTYYVLSGKGVEAIDRKKFDDAPAKTAKIRAATTRWKLSREGLVSLILADDKLVVGGDRFVGVYAVGHGELLWEHPVDGQAYGLTATGGRLFVSTDRGTVHGFSTAPLSSPVSVSKQPARSAKLSPGESAKKIVRATGVSQGFALVMGSGAAALAIQLAEHTDLMLHVLPVRGSAKEARNSVTRAGLYGVRITVEDPASPPVYPSYFANMLVLTEDAGTPSTIADAEQLLRTVRPCGGMLLIKEGDTKARAALINTCRTSKGWKEHQRLSIGPDTWIVLERLSLPGAGQWTHQYADPGNTANSSDEVVHAPLRLLWYGEPGAELQSDRHHRIPAPLFFNGRVFLQQEDVIDPGRKNRRPKISKNYIVCFDAYNGIQYWRREVPGAYRIRMLYGVGNLACSEKGLFVAVEDKCLRLDPMTGETLTTYTAPKAADGEERLWGYVATVGNTLFGSISKENVTTWLAPESAQFSDGVFACDVDTGKLKWVYRGVNIRKGAIAATADRLFITDLGVLSEERLENRRIGYAYVPSHKRRGRHGEPLGMTNDMHKIMALDAKTGTPAWKSEVDLKDCGGNVMYAIHTDGVLLFAGHFSTSHKVKQRMVALDADNGSVLWHRYTDNQVRPTVIRGKIYSKHVFDLRTGEPEYRMKRGKQVMRKDAKTGESVPVLRSFVTVRGCGALASSDNMLFYRCGSAASYDLRTRKQVVYRGTRTGCWFNMIPVGGIVIQVEASSGCICNFAIQATVVYEPVPDM